MPYLLAIIMIESVGIVSFCELAARQPTVAFKYLVLVVVAGAVFLALREMVQKTGWWRSVFSTLTISLAFVAVFQLLAFTYYKGLAKDISPLTSEHILQSVMLFAVLVCIHLLMLVAAALSTKRYFFLKS